MLPANSVKRTLKALRGLCSAVGPRMANSRFEYVRKFESEDQILPECWIVVRLDGKGFTKFCKAHDFEKPNDKQGLDLMDACATEVLNTFGDIRLGFGQSDEYSFVIHKSSTLYGRRASKLVSIITSIFSASYVFRWQQHFPEKPLKAIPCFDGRAIAYPTDTILLDYLSWRQSDAHINNQYNTCFWNLVKSGLSPEEAQNTLKGTQTDFKNELLHSKFGINYNSLPQQFRKGSVVFREAQKLVVKESSDGSSVIRERMVPVVRYDDIIGRQFWQAHPRILS